MKKFSKWLELREQYGVVPSMSQQTTNQTMLQNIPPQLVAKLQSLGPNMNRVMNRANQMMQSKQSNSLTQALNASLGEYESSFNQQPTQ